MFYIIQSQDTLGYLRSIHSDENATPEWTWSMDEAKKFDTVKTALSTVVLDEETYHPVILSMRKDDSTIWGVFDFKGRLK